MSDSQLSFSGFHFAENENGILIAQSEVEQEATPLAEPQLNRKDRRNLVRLIKKQSKRMRSK